MHPDGTGAAYTQKSNFCIDSTANGTARKNSPRINLIQAHFTKRQDFVRIKPHFNARPLQAAPRGGSL